MICKLKALLSGVVAGGILLAVVPAWAVFPGIDVTLWEENQGSDDRTNPDFLRFHELAAQGKYGQALTLIDGVIAAQPKHGTAVLLKAIMMDEMGRYKEAYELLQRGVSLQFRHPATSYLRCRLHRNLGNMELSLRACHIAVMQHPKSPEVYYELAQTLEFKGDMTGANQALAKSAELDPKNSLYHYRRGMNFVYLNQTRNAEQAFLKALAVNDQDIEAAYQLGYLYAVNGDFGKAESYLNRIWSQNRGHSQAESARTLLELIKKNEVGKLPRETVPYKYHFGRSQKFYQDGQYGRALLEIQTAARLKPDDQSIQEILIGLASLFLHLDLAEDAVKHLIQVSGNNPVSQAKGYQELGDISVIRGDLDTARKYYEKSLDLGDPNGLARLSLDELPARPPEPPYVFNREEVFTEPAEALNRKGEIFAHYGMFNRAQAIYNMVLRIDPKHLMAKLNSATAYYNKGQFPQAIALLEKILVSHPNHEHLLSHRVLLAKSYARNGDRDGAVKNLKIIKNLRPEALTTLKSDPAFKALTGDEIFH